MKNIIQNLTFVAVIIFLCGIQNSYAQYYSIHGAVIDANTKKPLPNANVFIANSLLGDATNELGFFIIRNVPAGTYEIVASVVGFQVEKQVIRVTSGVKKEIIFELTPKAIPLPEIVVSARDQKEWRKNLKKFTELLIGKTQNASESKILNPHVLEFSKTSADTFKANATEPIIIENKALGYKLYYVLEYFEATSQYIKYSGIPKFEELAPDTPEQLKTWQQNRMKAYNGSLRHFLTTICENYDLTKGTLKDRKYKLTVDRNGQVTQKGYRDESHIEKEGFHVLWIRDSQRNPQFFELVNTNKFLIPGELQTEKHLKFSGYLQIQYTKETPEVDYHKNISWAKIRNFQVSWIKLEADSVLIDTHGRYFDKFKIITLGYWSWERLADMVPLDYTPDNSEI